MHADQPMIQIDAGEPGDHLIAARTALAEGEAIVRATRELFNLCGLSSSSSRLRARKPDNVAEPPAVHDEAPCYRPADETAIRAVRIMVRLAQVTRKRGLRAAAYRDAGARLQALQRRYDGAAWRDLVRTACGLSVSRAYELIAIATGKKPLATLRSERAARARKLYQAKSKAKTKKSGRKQANG
jgi:hypothetical protein